ncbi:MAG: transposase [Microthrixaceae bacterium]|nr:transposase [Microthrixaceae bacterium]
MCDHTTGRVVWAAKGRSKEVVGAFFDALGDERAALLEFVTADGATWITDVVAARAPDAIVCLDTFHVIGWATKALDEVRREEWNKLRRAGAAKAAKAFKGLRFLLRRNWENLTAAQKGTIRDLEKANNRAFRAWQLKEELRDIFDLPLLKAQRALDDWLAYASRSKLPSFVKLARTIRSYRASIEATIEWRFTNGIAESNNAAIGRIRANARRFPAPHPLPPHHNLRTEPRPPPGPRNPQNARCRRGPGGPGRAGGAPGAFPWGGVGGPRPGAGGVWSMGSVLVPGLSCSAVRVWGVVNGCGQFFGEGSWGGGGVGRGGCGCCRVAGVVGGVEPGSSIGDAPWVCSSASGSVSLGQAGQGWGSIGYSKTYIPGGETLTLTANGEIVYGANSSIWEAKESIYTRILDENGALLKEFQVFYNQDQTSISNPKPDPLVWGPQTRSWSPGATGRSVVLETRIRLCGGHIEFI